LTLTLKPDMEAWKLSEESRDWSRTLEKSEALLSISGADSVYVAGGFYDVLDAMEESCRGRDGKVEPGGGCLVFRKTGEEASQ